MTSSEAHPGPDEDIPRALAAAAVDMFAMDLASNGEPSKESFDLWASLHGQLGAVEWRPDMPKLIEALVRHDGEGFHRLLEPLAQPLIHSGVEGAMRVLYECHEYVSRTWGDAAASEMLTAVRLAVASAEE